MLLRGYRKDSDGVEQLVDIINIPEFTYSGKDMGERSITATINHPSPIDFRAGDFVEFEMQSLNINPGGMDGGVVTEKFYLYTMPTVKKTARPMTHGTAFEHTITLYPAQYELSLVQMRDLGNAESANDIIYTGFDNVTFVGGAVELMRRIMFVLDEAYGKGTWTYFIADEIDEIKNKSLESFTFSFSGNTVMDALLKLNDKEGINTTFFINNRTIYVGFKRPYFCRVLDDGNIDQNTGTQMFNFRYGKTSHENIALNYGGLFDITKSVGSETPITKLFSYGAARNINRYYCSDRIKPGRYVNRLMLPSFDRDGKTDYILSEKGIEKFGIREGTKTFDYIYPSLRYMTYGDLRQVQYCIKLQASGVENEDINNPHYPIARVQCYKVVPSDKNIGVNALVPCAPPEDLTVYIHATGVVVKVVLCGGENALNRQLEKDFNHVPTKTLGGKDYIPGSCFAIHDRGFDLGEIVYYNESREAWFENPDSLKELPYSEDQKDEIKMNQITYRNTPFLTDLFVFESYDQTNFSRDGYSAWGWSRLNSQYVSEGGVVAHDTLPVNEIIEVEPVVIPDTDLNINGFGERQETFDIYIRDVGFKIDEQNDFGENVFVLTGELTVSILDGNLEGQEFNISGDITDFQKKCVCAFNDDGSINDDFFNGSDYNEGRQIAERAFANGAIWRLRLLRSNLEEDGLSGLNIALPTERINAKQGDHLVLLNLYMPDIYVHAAENRLLRETEKFLDANDNGSISYSVNFDKVRMQQIPNYALQIREGLNVRMQDSDLAITTENDVKTIFDGELISDTSLYKTTYTSTDVIKEYYTYEHRDYYDIEDSLDKRRVVIGGKEEEYITGVIKLHCKPNFDPNNKIGVDLSYTCEMETGAGRLTSDDASNPNFDVVALDNKMKFRVMNREFITRANNSFYHYVPSDNTIELTVKELRHKEASIDFYATLIWGSFVQSLPLKVYPDPNNQEEFDVYVVAEYDLQETHEYGSTEFTPNTRLLEYGREIYCPSKILIDFKPKKHYEIIIELFELDLMVPDPYDYPILALLNNLGSDSIYYQPTCEVTDIKHSDNSVVFRFDFDTVEGFNDSHSYYPAVLYKSNNVIEKIRTKLLSVIESDVKGTEDLDYADFILDTVNIHVYDSNPSAQPIKEITASLSEQQDASAWASLMNKVDEAVMEGNQNSAIIENLVDSARKNYRSILALKDSIFDPDGACDQTFLQVMMMQIGADSMNYRMLKTSIDFNGKSHNCLIKNNVSFEAGSDTLYHYVYSQGAKGGTWEISALSGVTLDGTSVYYIALKCQREGLYGEWICETVQHKVDEEPNYWYFNWGILTLDSAGIYTLTETRGNAYMYGDNLICGKISDIAKKSWFDLTRGEFVLGQTDSGAAFEYKNGVLTIGGINDDSINSILTRLGVVESNADSLMYLKDALEDGTTDISGGLVATNLILMRNINGVIRGGISGIDDDSGINNGVAFWSGGDYESALLQARLDNMSKTLPVLLTKKGVGSNIGCFEVVSSNQVAIYNSDKTSRILYTIGSSADISMKFQTKKSGVFVDLFVADNSSVDTNIVSKIMNGNPDGEIVKNTDIEYTGVYKTNGLSIPQGYKANINYGHKAVFIMKFNCDTYVKQLKFGAGSKLEFMRTTSSTSNEETQFGADVNLEGIEATVDMKNDYVKFEVPLPEYNSTLSDGWYYFKITATKFIRTNTSGSSFEVTFNEKNPIVAGRINKGEVLFALKQDLSFTKVEDTDTSMIRIGSDGLKVAVNSSTNFIIKTAAKNNKLDFIINGLPSATEVSTSGQIYSDGGTLKVYGR